MLPSRGNPRARRRGVHQGLQEHNKGIHIVKIMEICYRQSQTILFQGLRRR
jgi:hypothetical protein